MKKLLPIITFVLLLTLSSYGLAASIAVQNYSFELPGEGKIKGWDQVDGAYYVTGGAPAEVPGWESDGTVSDSGVEGLPNSHPAIYGTYNGFMMGGDPDVYQLLNHTIKAGFAYQLTVAIANTGSSSGVTAEFYYLDGTTRTVIATQTFAFGAVDWTDVTLSFTSNTSGAYIGKNLGIQFRTPSNWAGIDNVRVSVDYADTVYATAVNPTDGDTLVGVDEDLAWAAYNNWAVDLYFGPESEPNLIMKSEYKRLTNSTATSWDPGTLDYSTPYYWCVDVIEPNEPNSIIHKGLVWTFTTVPQSPIINVEPADVLIAAGQTATFTVDATNPLTLDKTGMTYEWYKVGQAGVLSTATTLEITNAQVADEGKYYCKVIVTSSGASKETRQASLLIARLVSHWPFDGNLNDIISGYNGNGTPTYGTGIIGSQAVSFAGSSSSPLTVPTAAHTNRAWTLSWWDNSAVGAGGSGVWESTICAGNGVGAGGYEIFETGRVDSYRYVVGFNIGGGYKYTPDIATAYPRGIWHLQTITFDPATSKALWYVDGVKVNEYTGVNFTTFSGFYIGNSKDLTQPFTGLVDDLRLYNYPLDAWEVANLYINGKPGETVCVERPELDTTGPEGVPDCKVNLYEFADMASQWLDCGRTPANLCLE